MESGTPCNPRAKEAPWAAGGTPCRHLAAGYNVPLATGAAAHQIYTIARAQGRGRQDQTCLLDTIRSLGGKGTS